GRRCLGDRQRRRIPQQSTNRAALYPPALGEASMVEPEKPALRTILSHYQAKPLLEARERGDEAIASSTTLNLREREARLDGAGVHFEDEAPIPWAVLEEIAANDSACFLVEGGDAWKIQFFSETLNRA